MPIYAELRGKTALITGGANGIGAAMVRAFHNQGACVCFCDVDVPAAKRLVREFDGQIEFFKVDLRKEGEIKQWISQVASRFKRIDALINNAAADPRIRLEDTTTKAWDDLVARNLRAFFLTSREASKWMTQIGRAS